MSHLRINISFPQQPELDIDLAETQLSALEVPEWAYFKNHPCPGNILHGPRIDYCRLACQLNPIIGYFSNIKSFEKGSLTILEDDFRTTKLNTDAQTIFFHAFWIILFETPCTILKQGKRFRKNYVITADINRLFYTFFSIFLVDSFVKSPSEIVSIEKFRDQLDLFKKVLKNLLERIRMAAVTTSDSSKNGIILFENIVELIEFDFSDLFEEMKNDSV